MADMMKKVPVREQDAKERACNFEEVCLGYNADEAVAEAQRCLNCKNAHCVQGCPVSINIPGFVEKVKEGDFAAAYQVIQRIQRTSGCLRTRMSRRRPSAKSKCVRGIKGEAGSLSAVWSVSLRTGAMRTQQRLPSCSALPKTDTR